MIVIPEAVRDRLVAEGYESVVIEPSVIHGSLHDYVYVYLTDARSEGLHVIVSDNLEWESGQPGYLVGAYEHYEAPAVHDLVVVSTIDEMARAVRRAVDEALAKCTS